MPSVGLLPHSGRVNFEQGFLNTNTFSYAYLRKPQILETIIKRFGEKYMLTLLTEGMGRKVSFDENRPFDIPKMTYSDSNTLRWFLEGYNSHLTKVVIPPTHNGANGVPFTIGLADDFFNHGDLIRFPSSPTTLARVVGERQESGGIFIYSLQFPNRTMLLSPRDMQSNIELAPSHNTHGENSERGYSHQYFPDAYENYMTTIRAGMKITGHALSECVWLQPSAPKGKSDKIWWYKMENDLMQEWFEAKEDAAWFGVRTMNANGTSDMKDANGYYVSAGDGIDRQLQDSIRKQYIPGTTDKDYWQALLNDLSRSADSYYGKEYYLVGGFELVSEFHNAMSQYVQGSSNIVTSDLITDVQGNKIKVKGWYTSFEGLFNAKITVAHNPYFDSPRFDNARHPRTQRSTMSHRGYILDMSTYNGIPNISCITKKNSEVDRSLIRKEIPGMVSLGKNNSGMSSSSYDNTEIQYLSEFAYVVRNPFNCAVIEPSLQ